LAKPVIYGFGKFKDTFKEIAMAMEMLFNLAGLKLSVLKKKERVLFEAYCFAEIYKEIYQFYSAPCKTYSQTITYNVNQEDEMLDANFLVCLIKDILESEEYTLTGIAYYIGIPEEVLYDLLAGIYKNPSPILWRKIIELHSTVRRELYQMIIKKIMEKG
jgi:hypothetical protein